MKVGYKTLNQDPTGSGSDLGDIFIPKRLFTQGGLWTWGDNTYGKLGDNTTTHRSSPVQTVAGGTNWKQVTASSAHVAAIKTDGTLWLWGRNNYGQLGTNNITDYSSPVQTVAAGTNWKQVACHSTSVAAIKTDGTLWLWGRNTLGQLGTNDITHYSSPVQTIAGGTNWKQIAGSVCFSAIKTDGTLWTWGDNTFGRLGDGTRTARSSPVQTAAGGTNWKQVACGQDLTAAIKTDGTLWTWGSNDNGGLGDGTTAHRSSPVQTVAGGTNWKQVACAQGFSRMAAIKTDGTLWVWGDNRGILGDNVTIHRSSPVQTVAGGTNWKIVALGYNHVVAIKTDGTLWTWGGGGGGALGTNNLNSPSSPVQTVAGGTNWKELSAGLLGTITIREDYY